MIEPFDLEDAIRRGIVAALEDAETRRNVSMQIEPFDAVDDSGDEVRVVAVIGPPDDLDFVVIVETDAGEIFPSVRDVVYRRCSPESLGCE